MRVGKYIVSGLVVFVVILTIALFSDEQNTDFDYTGIVYGINEGTNGYTFKISTSVGDIRCWYSECPIEFAYYGICGFFSDDGNIFFVSFLTPIGEG